MEKKELKLIVRRANNSAAGNPRFRIISWNDQILLNEIIKNGFIRDLKKGLFTEANASDSYSVGNKEGFVIDNIKIVATIKY